MFMADESLSVGRLEKRRPHPAGPKACKKNGLVVA
jgi:hypothetical protein